MNKVVLKLDLHDDKDKQKAMEVVSSLSGVDSFAMDMKEKKLTVIGDIDPVTVVGKLREGFHAEILTVGPAKEEKKDEGEKDDGNKNEGAKNRKEKIAKFIKGAFYVVGLLAEAISEFRDRYD